MALMMMTLLVGLAQDDRMHQEVITVLPLNMEKHNQSKTE